MSSTSPSRADVYERVTNRILTDLEAGTRPWQKPWNAKKTDGQIVRPLRHNGLPYNGINILLLWGAAFENGYSASRWMTFRQAIELGGCVRKGEHGSLVVYADRITRTEQDETGADVEREIPFMKGYTVFNVEQIGGLPESYYDRPAAPKAAAERHAQAEGFIAGTGVSIAHGGNRAFYAPAADRVQLPPFEAFKDPEAYYATALHELTHWTGHTSRNARAFGKRFGDEAYAFEELVAELGSAFLCCDLSITPEVRDDHAGYLAHWMSILKATSARSSPQRAMPRKPWTSCTDCRPSGKSAPPKALMLSAGFAQRPAFAAESPYTPLNLATILRQCDDKIALNRPKLP